MARPKGVALVTGAARRIGRAIAEALASDGHPVAVHANTSLSDAELVAGEIRSRGGTAAAVAADLTDPAAVRALVPRVAASLGPVLLLVNNASVFERDSIDSIDDEIWDRHFAVHVRAPALLTAAMAAGLPEGADGLVVNITDQRVLRPTPHFLSYTLSKSALWMQSQTLAQALAPRIRVNAIAPGPAMRNSRQSEDDFRRQVSAIPLQRGPDLAEFGAAIRYLRDTRSVTGNLLTLDGGQHLAWETPDVAGINE